MSSVGGCAMALLLLTGAASNAGAQMLSLPDGTPVRLRLMKTVTSAEAKVGETVDFEVTEPVISNGIVVIPKGSLAWGKVTKVEPKKRFGRGGELEVSAESVRLADGSKAQLRATREKGTEDMSGGRIAATIAASPVLVWVKGKDVEFQRGMESTAYLNGEARADEAALRRNAGSPGAAAGAETSADREAPAAASGALTNTDIVQMRKAGLTEDVITTKIRTSPTAFRTGAQDLIQLKEAGVGDQVIALMVEKSAQK
jgi:hypothetical protein